MPTENACRVVSTTDDPDLLAFQSAAQTLFQLAQANGWPFSLAAIIPVATPEGGRGVAAPHALGNMRAANIAKATGHMGLPSGLGAAMALKAYAQCAELLSDVLDTYKKDCEAEG